MNEIADPWRRSEVLVGGIEAGGTKFVCGIGVDPTAGLIVRAEFPTGDSPKQLLPELVDWFAAQQRRHVKLAALGIASFGPVDLHKDSPTYGYITSTPKRSWAQTDLISPFQKRLANIPIAFDTDVNGAALGEFFWGGAAGLSDFIYITMGTGIGVGIMTAGRLLHGLIHCEAGHIRIPRLRGDEFPGVCPFHGDCWEGLCCGPAIQARTGIAAQNLPSDHPAWRLEAGYIAMALANLICTLSPQRILLGGSVPKAGGPNLDNENAFFHDIRQQTCQQLNGYIQSPSLGSDAIRDYIMAAKLNSDAGIWGAIAL
ncbi:MAG TPA: ROK family protein, partial [Pirellulales bacterium]